MSTRGKSASAARNTTQKNNQFLILLGALMLVGIIVAAVFLLQKPERVTANGLPREVSVQQAAELREQGAFMMDVRELEEWQEFHLPGAVLIPLGELSSRLNEIPKDRPIVVVCRSGNRSAQGRDILLNAGFENVTSMGGGMNQWRAAGYPVESGN